MRRLLSIFGQRWFISLLGLAALAFLIWYGGPLVEVNDQSVLASPGSRWTAIAVLFGLWFASVLRRQLAGKLTNARLVNELFGAPREEAPAGPADEEIALLKQRLQGALGTLKKARLGDGGGRHYLYQLPWYVIIGPPGSGKTTALRNSGLRFPLADQFGAADIRGVGGTRNCDWFFTDEAILLDTAGRYATQESDASADAAAWLGFLELLKKYRRRRPINGVMVVVSVPEMLDQGQVGRSHHARLIRQRLLELHEYFNIRFPVYVLLTKCDLLPGFIEFFDDLDQEERAKVWGITFPEDCVDDSKDIVSRLEAELELLDRRLHERLLERMHRESSSRKRSLIFGFPQQFAALRPVVDGFLKEIFGSTRFEEDALLRGVYFVSGTQEGAPIDRLLGSLSEAFGVARTPESMMHDTGRSYFITRALRDVVFKEAGLAGTNLRLERRQNLLQFASYAGVILAIVVGALLWLTSYTRNAAYVDLVKVESLNAESKVEELAATQTAVLAALPALNAVRDLPGGYAERDRGAPLLMGFGLGQRRKLGSEAQEAYRRVLVRQLLPRVLLDLEAQLGRGETSFDERYESLKAYLMLEHTEHYDQDFLEAWLGYLMEESLRLQTTEDMALDATGHLRALLDTVQERTSPVSVRLDEELIKRVREELGRVPLAEQAYGRIRRGAPIRELEPFDPLAAAGPDAPLVMNRVSGQPMSEGPPGLFTKKGYGVFLTTTSQVAQYLSTEQWVFGDVAREGRVPAGGSLTREVGELYAQEYVSQWHRLLADIEIAKFANVSRAVQMLNLLSNPSASPIVRLLEAVERETSLRLSLGAAGEAAGKAGKILEGARDIIDQLRGDDAQPRSGTTGSATPFGLIENEFARLHAEVRGQDGSPPPLERTVGLLNELRAELSALESARGTELVDVARGQITEIIRRIELEVDRQPRPISRWLRNVAENARRVSLGNVRRELNTVWRGTGASFCRDAISGRYPIDREATQEIALDDFSRFFGPGGTMDSFFKQYLAPFVDTTQTPWRSRVSAAGGPSISKAAMASFQHADAIRSTFFAGGASGPRIVFELSPITMDADITHFVLNLEGQTISYRHTPEPPRELRWPGDGPRQVTIQLSPPAPGRLSSMKLEGPWAWFRLLDAAEVTPSPVRERFTVAFDVGGRRASYELRATSVLNPFRFPELGRFRCPTQF